MQQMTGTFVDFLAMLFVCSYPVPGHWWNLYHSRCCRGALLEELRYHQALESAPLQQKQSVLSTSIEFALPRTPTTQSQHVQPNCVFSWVTAEVVSWACRVMLSRATSVADSSCERGAPRAAVNFY